MEAFKLLFMLGLLGILAGAAVVFSTIVSIIGLHWVPLVSVVCFCLAVVVLAVLVSELERQRLAINYKKSVQTMQIKVEADTSQATAALVHLEQRVQSVTNQITALNRLAVLNVMGES